MRSHLTRTLRKTRLLSEKEQMKEDAKRQPEVLLSFALRCVSLQVACAAISCFLAAAAD